MNPRSYEEYVGAHFRQKGYEVTVTPYSQDWGIDCFATRGTEKIAVQVKMYGEGVRPVNRKMIMELYGAAHYFDCTKIVLATDGRILSDAQEVANKLNIELLFLEPGSSKETILLEENCFEDIWRKYILPLKGKLLSRKNGETNKILDADWSGIKRETSSGNKQTISIEIFREVVNHLRKHGSITRKEINDQYEGRASSGVCLILSQAPCIYYDDNSPAKLIWKGA